MRARFVFEKFTDDSDPIHDLGIGIYTPRSFNSSQELYEFLYDIMPALFRVENPAKLLARSKNLYFTGNVILELKKYITAYITMPKAEQFWSSWYFDIPAFHSYVVNRAKKERSL